MCKAQIPQLRMQGTHYMMHKHNHMWEHQLLIMHSSWAQRKTVSHDFIGKTIFYLPEKCCQSCVHLCTPGKKDIDANDLQVGVSPTEVVVVERFFTNQYDLAEASVLHLAHTLFWYLAGAPDRVLMQP